MEMVALDPDGKRTEHDGLGSRSIPRERLYGIHTLRGLENFDLGTASFSDYPRFIHALALIKKAACLANRRIGVMPREMADAIAGACDEIMEGRHRQEFVVSILEGSGGTSINMNMNEVIANRALRILGHEAGDYQHLHPNDHVNLGQSTNDVVPSALKLAAFRQSAALLDGLQVLAGALSAKAAEFSDLLRVGRTCMQAAQPMTLGQAFGGYAAVVERVRGHLGRRREDFLVLPLGGTALGTGLGSAPGYREAVYEELSRLFAIEVSMSEDPFDGMQNADCFARFSAELRTTADAIAKIASDLIILSSGPNSGIGEVVLPAVQAGSSIMPGKVNPVMPIMMQQVAFVVTGNDIATALAARGGQLEINHFEPIIASRLFESIDILANGARLFSEKCIQGLSANRDRCLDNLTNSSALASVFLPMLGYAAVAELVKESQETRKSFIALAIERGLLSEEKVMATLRAATSYPFTAPGTDGETGGEPI